MRRIVNKAMRTMYSASAKLITNRFDDHFLHPDVPLATDAYHRDFLVREGSRAGKRVLEIGSREVTGRSEAR